MHIHTAFINGIPDNPCDDFLLPVIPVILAARIMLGEKLLLVIARFWDFPFIQNFADAVCSIPFQGKAVYQPDSGRSRFINNQVVFVLRVFPVAEWCSRSHEFPFQCPYMLAALDLFGNIPRIKFI